MKTALVTGANQGIGLEITKQLGRNGFEVFMGVRDLSKGEKAISEIEKKESLHLLSIDMGNIDSIDSAIQDLKSKNIKLDLLINNAAVLFDEGTSIQNISKEKVLQTFNTNSIGPFFLIQNSIPLLKKGSRIINVSSGAGEISNGMGTYSPVYSISKTTLNAITCQFAHVLKRESIAVNSVCPGWVRTSMGGSTATRSVEKGAETILWLALEASLEETGKFWRDKKVISW